MLFSGTRYYEYESCNWYELTVMLYSVTSYIIDQLENYLSMVSTIYSACKHSLSGYVIETEDEIYNYVFDVEFYEVSHKLEVLLYRNGFDIREDVNNKRLWDFDLSQ